MDKIMRLTNEIMPEKGMDEGFMIETVIRGSKNRAEQKRCDVNEITSLLSEHILYLLP